VVKGREEEAAGRREGVRRGEPGCAHDWHAGALTYLPVAWSTLRAHCTREKLMRQKTPSRGRWSAPAVQSASSHPWAWISDTLARRSVGACVVRHQAVEGKSHFDRPAACARRTPGRCVGGVGRAARGRVAGWRGLAVGENGENGESGMRQWH